MTKLCQKFSLAIISLLTSATLYAQLPKAKPFNIECGEVKVRIVPYKAWTPDIIKFKNETMAQQNGFSGLVADIKGGNLFIGSGHDEGGKEKVLSFKLIIDGKEVAIPENGETIKCERAETVKESYLDSLKLTSKVTITAESIKETHDLAVTKDLSIHKLYGFLHCWSNKSTEWIGMTRNNEVISGKFDNSADFELLGDVKWAANFLPESEAVIYTEFPKSLPKGEGRGHCYWDIKNYHKQYYQAMADKRVKAGDKFYYEMTSKFFTATNDNWKDLAIAAGKKQSVKAPNGFSFINFGKAANMSLKDEVANDKKGGWFDQGPNNDLSTLPTGTQTFANIPYQIPETGKSCVILRGAKSDHLPLDSGPIEINRKAEIIYFLSACGWNTSIGERVAFITVRYKQGGLYLDIPVRFKKETAGWWKPGAISNGDIAWAGRNISANVGVFSFGWINPNPDEEIDSITFVSTNSTAVPAFIGATIVTDKEIAAKLKTDLKEKLRKTNTTEANPEVAKLEVNFKAEGAIPVPGDAASMSIGFGMGGNYLTAAKGLVGAGKQKPFFRLQIRLTDPSPAEGVWDFTKLDKYLDYIEAAGAEPMLCFGPGGPIWMATPMEGVSMRRNWRPRDVDEYIKYCEAVLRHCNFERKNPVKWWQIGNETELKGWSYKYYVKLYKQIAPRLKKIDPTIKLGGPVNCSPNVGWAGELLREAGSMVDFLSYHHYGYSEPYDSPVNYIMGKTLEYKKAVSKYLEQTYKLAQNRYLPVIVTEANTNPRYQRPLGTDPKIRTMFNAAWYMSALNQFVMGGGRSLCYFTLDGGFGACASYKGKFTLFPVYHSIWLFRKFGQGSIAQLNSSTPKVEAYVYNDGATKRLIVINKMDTPVKVELSFDEILPEGQAYILNSENAKACANFNEKKEIEFLAPQDTTWNEKTVTLNMTPYEVFAWETK